MITVAKPFVLETISAATDSTWLTLLDAVLKARIEQDPADVLPEIWKAFLLFAFVLVPCVQSW